MSTGRVLGAAAVCATLVMATSGFSVSADAAPGPGQAQFVKQADAVCRSLAMTVQAASDRAAGIVSSGLPPKQEFRLSLTLLSGIAATLDDAATKLAALKAPQADAADLADGAAQIHVIASLMNKYVHTASTLADSLKKEEAAQASVKASVTKAESRARSDLRAIGLANCGALSSSAETTL